MARHNAPAPALLGDLFRFTVRSRTNGSLVETTHDYMGGIHSASDGVTAANMATAHAAFFTAVTAVYNPCLTTKTVIQDITAACISKATIASRVIIANELGALSGDALPDEVAAVMLRVSTLKGQHGRGRFSMPAVPSAFTTPATDPNSLNTGGLAAYTNLCTVLMTSITAGGVLHFPVVSTRPAAGGTGLYIAAQQLSDQTPSVSLGTVRRRKEGRGQ